MVSNHAPYSTRQDLVGFTSPRATVPAAQLQLQLQEDRLGFVAEHLVSYQRVSERTANVRPAPRRADISDPASHPLHGLEDSLERVRELQKIAELIFDETVTFDRVSGELTLRLGAVSGPVPPVDAVTVEYQEDLGALPKLIDQGDGMQSVFGLMMPLVASTRPIALLDEPEAFLHPPQAFALGRTLGKLAKERGIQVILATHDKNLVAGALDADVDVSVVRLDKVDDRYQANQLVASEVKELWTNPVLRYSNLLDGLFHRVVVLCEFDRDCRFYAASLDAAHSSTPMGILPGDVLFISTHGKDGMPGAADLMGRVHVPVVASPDLDVLNDQKKLRALYESLGNQWSEDLSKLYKRATAEFQQPKQERSCREVQYVVDGVLSENSDGIYGKEIQERVRKALAVESPWSKLKTTGVIAFRSDHNAALQLLDKLDRGGLVAVRVGELEQFAIGAGTKGPKWLAGALELRAFESQDSKDHARRILCNMKSRSTTVRRLRAQRACLRRCSDSAGIGQRTSIFSLLARTAAGRPQQGPQPLPVHAHWQSKALPLKK